MTGALLSQPHLSWRPAQLVHDHKCAIGLSGAAQPACLSGRSRMMFTVLMPRALASCMTSCTAASVRSEGHAGRGGFSTGRGQAAVHRVVSCIPPMRPCKPSAGPPHLAHVAGGPILHQGVPLSQLHKLVQQAHSGGGAAKRGAGGAAVAAVVEGVSAPCEACLRRLLAQHRQQERSLGPALACHKQPANRRT